VGTYHCKFTSYFELLFSFIMHRFIYLSLIHSSAQNPSSQSLMRWFHVAQKHQNIAHSSSSRASSRKKPGQDAVDYPFSLKVSHRNARKFLSVDMNIAKIIRKKKELSGKGLQIRYEKDRDALDISLAVRAESKMFSLESPGKPLFCTVIEGKERKSDSDLSISIEVAKLGNSGSEEKERPIDIEDSSLNTNGDDLTFMPSQESLRQSLALEVVIRADDSMESSSDLDALPYTREEKQILASSETPNDIRAGIIWYSIERERNTEPISSTKILSRLFSSRIRGDSTIPPLHKHTFFTDDDAVIIHAVDAVIYHYSTDFHKVDPFDFTVTNPAKVEQTSLSLHSQKYYKATVINSTKMKIGHKIASSLLTWASHMHLNSRSRQQQFNLDTEEIVLSDDIEFVGEILRLVAARWREASYAQDDSSDKSEESKRRNKRKVRSKGRRGRKKSSG